MNHIAAVVVNWNRFEATVECVTLIQAGEMPCRKIVIVDNASTDGSGRMLKEHFSDMEAVTVIEQSTNTGFAAGANAGIKAVLMDGPRFVFLINNDAVVDPRCLAILTNVLDSSKDCGMAGPAILFYGAQDKVWQGGGVFNVFKAGVIVPDKNKAYSRISKSIKEVTFLSGCALLVRSEVFSSIGMFDEDYFMYGEDADLCLRAKKGGIRLLYAPEAKAFHKIKEGGGERASAFVLYHLGRSGMLLYCKAFSRTYAFYGLILQWFLFTPYRVVQMIKSGSGFEGFSWWLRGVWDGFRRRHARALA